MPVKIVRDIKGISTVSSERLKSVDLGRKKSIYSKAETQNPWRMTLKNYCSIFTIMSGLSI